jgi:phosphoglucosamine mutase
MFGTSGVRGPVGQTVTADLALSLGRAVGSTGIERVVVGRDPRDSGETLADALSAGLRECGVDVIRLGLASTPTVARSVALRDADVGVVVTASHNPPEDNGLKFWNPSGQAFRSAQREELVSLVESEDYDLVGWDGVGEETSWDGAVDAHREALVESVAADADDPGESLDGLSVVVDVGNGAGRVAADALYELGCEVTTLNAQPDGRFPGRPSEPKAENCGALCALVGSTDADLGIAHDGDADRMMAVTAEGEFVTGDHLLALFGRAAAEAGTRVAAPVDTSLAVDDAVAEVGAEVVRTRVGDVFVAEKASEPDVAFGGEPSGAWIWPDETLCPDGPLAAVTLAEMVHRDGPLADQLATIDSYPLRRENVETDAKAAIMDAVAATVADEYEEVDTIDGVRVGFDDGWFLIRASGTQPLVRLTAEARDESRCEALLDEARELVERSAPN